MKTSARFLAMLLAVLMIAGAALSVSAFSDVTAGVDHATAISVLNQLGVIGGYEDGTFKPDQNVTRAEMAKLVYVLYTTFTDAGAGTVKFNDVKTDNWAVGYISWCASKGIIGGYGDGNFGPSDNVTYDQALKMVAGTLGYNEWDPAQWPVDVRMKALNDLKLGEGIPTTVKGGDKLTRGQVAQIMYNALQAPMKETKTINQKLPGTEFYLPVEQNKTLAVDVWNFTEATFAIVGTENYGAKTNDGDKIAIAEVTEDGIGSAEAVELKDLGLEAFADKTDDLINLHITTISKNEEMLASASINGSVTDRVSISYTSDHKTLKINGVAYTAKDFAEDATDPIALYDVKGNKLDTVIFDEDDKLVKDFYKTLAPNAKNLVRIVDFDGNGKVDAFVIEPMYAYQVTSVSTKSGDKYVNYKSLDGSKTGSTLVTNVYEVSLQKNDIFVGATMGDTLYADVVTPVDTYATKLNSKDGKVTLNEVGEVKFNKLTVAGVEVKELGVGILGDKNVQTYYIYEGEIIYTNATGSLTDYNFVIFQDVEKTEGEFNPVTMQEDTAYVATLLVDGEELEVVLASDVAAVIGGVEYSAAEFFDAYTHGENSDGKREYNYTLVAAYEEDENGYVLTIDANLDEEVYTLIPAGATLKYNAKNDLYSITHDDLSVNKVDLDETSAVYYRYAKEGTASGSFKYLGKYTQDSITDKSFTAITYGTTYLAYNTADKTYTLLATIVDDEIEGQSDAIKDYTSDGRLVLYAPVASSVLPKEGKLYNAYTFMDNETLTNKEEAIDTNKEYDKVTNKGTEAGYLYGFNNSSEVYEKITSKSGLKTAKSATLTSVITTKDLIGYKESADLEKIDSSVVIWGLSDKDDNGVYTQLTLAELADMYDLVDEYNKAQREELEEGEEYTDLEVRMIMLSYKDSVKDSDGNDVYVVSSIIVEIFEADEDGVVYSVNPTLINNFNK
ncbi:MAG: S-layer homology domain-containing protein [Ruminococcaceae bacterium]|nr:S-layer homology domain-containing protein [Oscillospiraceae bacterium]